MPNYQNGKIYCIRSFKTDDIYIGSTTQPLCKRMVEHRSKYKGWLKGVANNCTSFELMKYGDTYIELIALYPCNSKEELKREEGKYHREMDCVNKRIESRTHKEWYEDNKEIILQKAKEYHSRPEIKERIKEKRKEYRSRPEVKEKEKKIYEKGKQKITCICGKEVTLYNKKIHERSQKHQKFIQSQS
jgi:hypothetical protein